MYIEPVGIQTVIDKDEGVEYSYGSSPAPTWKIFEEMGYDLISTRRASSEIEKEVQDFYSKAFSFNPELEDLITPRNVGIRPRIRKVYQNKHSTVFPDSQYGNHLLFLAKTKRKVRKAIKDFENQMNSIDRNPVRLPRGYSSSAEISFRASYGEEFANFLVDKICKPVRIQEEFDNRFEEKVYNDINKGLTSCLTTNADLFVGSETNENREYDILLPIAPHFTIYIEVKRLLPSIGTHNESNWKRNIIGKPFEYKAMLQQQSENMRDLIEDKQWNQTECVVVVDSLENSRFSNFKEMAKDRGIHLLERDEEGEYLKKISELVSQIVYKYTSPLEDPIRNRRSL